jgi:hypothetical protein
MPIPDSPCQACGVSAPVRYVQFHKNIGLGFSRRYERVEGRLCRNCIDSYFWNFTSVTALVGWFGIISLTVSPFFILNNLYYFLTSLTLPRSPINRSQPISPLRFVGIAVILGISTLCMCMCALSASVLPTLSQFDEFANSTGRTPSTPAPFAAASSSPTPTAADCLHWSNVSEEWVGKRICVYGVLRRLVVNGSEYDLLFDSGIDTMYVVMDTAGFPGITPGRCINASGVVQKIDNRLVLVAARVTETDSISVSCR